MLKNIINGHLNELLNKYEKLSKDRMDICRACPLLENTNLGYVCSSKLYLDLETGIAHAEAKPATIRGCGCRLSAKTRLIDAGCPANKW